MNTSLCDSEAAHNLGRHSPCGVDRNRNSGSVYLEFIFTAWFIVGNLDSMF